VNTLVVATGGAAARGAAARPGRREPRQVAAAFGWHALFVTVTGVVAGRGGGRVTWSR